MHPLRDERGTGRWVFSLWPQLVPYIFVSRAFKVCCCLDKFARLRLQTAPIARHTHLSLCCTDNAFWLVVVTSLLLLFLRLYDVVHTERKLTLVFEYLDQDLKKYLDVCEGGLESNILKSFLYQLLRGVAYCHHHRV